MIRPGKDEGEVRTRIVPKGASETKEEVSKANASVIIQIDTCCHLGPIPNNMLPVLMCQADES